MKVSEYIDLLINGDCSKLSFADVGDMALNPGTAPTAAQLVNQGKFIGYINLANLALHKRYHLLKKELELDNPTDGEEFSLPTDFLVPVQAFYAEDHEPVTIKDDSLHLVDKIDTAVSILMPEPFKIKIKGVDDKKRTPIILRYAAAPKKALLASLDLKISEVYTDPLLNYASYKAYSTLSGDIKDENNTFFLRYESACRQLVNFGMGSNNQIDTNTKLTDNGFV